MFVQKFVVSSALAAALSVSFVAGAGPSAPHGEDCALAGYTVTHVAAYRIEERVGRGTVQRLAGARLFIPAQTGLTRELIAAKVLAHLEKMNDGAMAECPLDVDGVRVTVTSGATGYWVQLAGKTPRDAKEILARAQHLSH